MHTFAATTAALRVVTGCPKTYVMLFAEREGFEHVHFHIVPRVRELQHDQLGAGALAFVNCAEEEWVPASERARLAVEIGAHVRERLPRFGSSP